MYGLDTSPADWPAFRDQGLAGFTWQDRGRTYGLERTPETSVWSIVEFEGEAGKNPKTCGYLVIYVDDFLAIGPTSLVENVIKRINQEWVCSTPEWVNKAGWTKFCGMELKWDEDGETLRVGQPLYISELMQRHEVTMAKPAPFYKPEVPEDPVVGTH